MNKQEKVFELFPFLQGLPPSIYTNLDKEDWYLPDTKQKSEIVSLVEQLEKQLPAHIMLYRCSGETRGQMGKPNLCAYLLPARLNSGELNMLKAAEERWKHVGICFVAYASPMQQR